MKRNSAFEKYDCMTTKSAKDALKLIEENKFDLLVYDVMMPEISGIQLLFQVKAKHPDPAVVMIQ
ncbi:MAG: response regulator [Thermodesulfobacteriota bacterium]|nr:response regulator [Thermodesulfobacteriota bacterium]